MDFIPVPLHFASSFLLTVAALAAAWLSFSREGFGPARSSARYAYSIGWVLLGLGEAIHGSQIAASDLGQSVLALRSGGFAFIVIGLLSRHPGEAKADQVAVGASGVLLPSLLGVSAGVLALRSSLSGRTRIGIALLILGASEALFAFGEAAAQVSGAGTWYLAHGARLVGAVAVGWWLSQAIRSSIQVRFIAVFVVLMLVVVVAISSAMTQVFAANIREESLERSALEGQFQQSTISEREREAVAGARRIADTSTVRSQAARRDTAALSATARAAQSPGGLLEEFDFLGFLDQGGRILGFSAVGPAGPTVDDSEALGLAGSAVVQSALGGVEASSVDAIGEARLSIVAAFPISAPRGTEPPGSPLRQAGVVVMGNVLDLGYLATLPGVDLESEDKKVSLITLDKILVTSFREDASTLLSDTDRLRFQVFEAATVIDSEGVVGDVNYFHSFVPLERRDNEVIGALVISQRSEVVELAQRDVGQILFLIALIVAAVAVALSYVSGSRITKPLLDLTGAARRIREGDLEVRVGSVSEDEVGTLGEAFDDMAVSLSKLTDDLRSSAEEESRLRSQIETVIQSMADGVLAVDPEGSVTVVNREAARILGKPATSFVGQQISSVLDVRSEDGESIDLPVFELRSGSDRGVIANGADSTHVAVISAPIPGDGTSAGAVAVLRDLTAEIQVENMKTEFLSNISHELRTPLTPIKGYADILRRKGIPKKTATMALDSITDSTRRLERIVNMLVDVSAMQAGRLVPEMVELDLDAITRGLVESQLQQHSEAKIVRRGFTSLPLVVGDARLLPRAIDELIDNAIKFGGGRPNVSVSAQAAKGDIRITVADTGVGVPANLREEIFNDFMQVDASATRQEGGLGLGLSYVQRILDAHRAHLFVESAESKGSKFTIVLGGAAVKAKRKPAKRKPAKRKPAKRKPAKRKPAKRKPAKRKPAKRKPAKRKPRSS